MDGFLLGFFGRYCMINIIEIIIGLGVFYVLFKLVDVFFFMVRMGCYGKKKKKRKSIF